MTGTPLSLQGRLSLLWGVKPEVESLCPIIIACLISRRSTAPCPTVAALFDAPTEQSTECLVFQVPTHLSVFFLYFKSKPSWWVCLHVFPFSFDLRELLSSVPGRPAQTSLSGWPPSYGRRCAGSGRPLPALRPAELRSAPCPRQHTSQDRMARVTEGLVPRRRRRARHHLPVPGPPRVPSARRLLLQRVSVPGLNGGTERSPSAPDAEPRPPPTPLPCSVLSRPCGLCSRSTFFRKSSLSIYPKLIFAPRESVSLRLQLGGRAPGPGTCGGSQASRSELLPFLFLPPWSCSPGTRGVALAPSRPALGGDLRQPLMLSPWGISQRVPAGLTTLRGARGVPIVCEYVRCISLVRSDLGPCSRQRT